ncbi:MAG TPA: N-glycosylase/DNA lyase [Pyrinomonadaceae bacterium]|nr:N-glycosylase/DNA lyase [Pyrinomonadaceae bacterium]
MKREKEPLTFENIKRAHSERREEIRRRLSDFEAVWRKGSDRDLWEEMVFCFFTGGCSARMGLRSVEAVRSILLTGTREEFVAALRGVHRYPNERARYIEESRNFLLTDCDLRLRQRLAGFADRNERRDWLVKEKGIKGLGYKEASHFLRNIGFTGYAILDKHVLRSMAELKIIDDPKPPNSGSRYLTVEERLKSLASTLGIDFDELDLVLWSMKTGEILK